MSRKAVFITLLERLKRVIIKTFLLHNILISGMQHNISDQSLSIRFLSESAVNSKYLIACLGDAYKKTMRVWKKAVIASIKNKPSLIIDLKDTHL